MCLWSLPHMRWHQNSDENSCKIFIKSLIKPNSFTVFRNEHRMSLCSFFPRAPCLLSPILQRPLSRVSESTLYCASENEPSQFPIKIRKNLPLLPCAPQCCNGSTSSMWWPILRSARLYSCKRTWKPHHSAIPPGPILPLYFSTSHLLFLFHFCPLCSLQANLSAILQWGHRGDEWACDSSGILWKPP